MVTRRRFLAANSMLIAAAGVGGGTAQALISGPVAEAAPGHGRAPVGLTWRPSRLLPQFAEPQRLQAASVAELPGEDQLLLTTLAGVVNRRRPELYFCYDAGDEAPDRRWLNDFSEDLQVTWHDDALSLLHAYAHRARGAIVYDPDVHDTINVATTMAGLKDCVVATAEQVKTYGLRMVEDLRGRFTGQDKVEIYRWQLDNLWDDCDHRLITGLPPTQTVDVDGVTWRTVAEEKTQVRDESNRTDLTIDLSQELGGEAIYVRFADAFGNDGWGASVASVKATADGTVVADFTPDTDEEATYLFSSNGASVGDRGNRFADGGSSWVYRFEPPAGTKKFTVTVDIWNQYKITATDTAPTRVEPFSLFRDYIVATKAMVVWLDPNGDPGDLLAEIFDRYDSTTPYLGWFSNDVAGEWGGVDLAAAHRVEVLAADFFANGAVHGGIPAAISSKIKKPKQVTAKNKIYLTLTFGEGDNIQFCQRHLRELWDDPHRGKVPTNWTISPVLADAGPAMYRYYQQTATANDLLVCGPSGAGYTYGNSWPDDSFTEYADLSDRYLDETGLDLVYAYSTGDGSTTFTDDVLKTYREHTGLRGIIQSSGVGGVVTGGELPVIKNFSPAGAAAEFKASLDDYAADWKGDRPFFIAGGVNAWNWTPTDVAELGDLLADDDRYEVVLGDTFFELLRGAGDDPQPPPKKSTAAARRQQAGQASGRPSSSAGTGSSRH